MLALIVMTAFHPAHAVTPQQLMGNWALQNAANCRYGTGGFNTKLQPLNPSESFLAESSGFGIFTFGPPQSIAANGTITGSVTRNFTALDKHFPASATVTGFVPSSSKVTYLTDVQTYHIRQNTITIDVQDEQGSIVAGARAGQTQVIDNFKVVGYVSTNRRNIVLSSPDAIIENITYSNGESYPRVCHRSTTLIKAY